MRLKRSWLSDRLRGGRRWFMPACVITYMDGRKLECGCGVKLSRYNPGRLCGVCERVPESVALMTWDPGRKRWNEGKP